MFHINTKKKMSRDEFLNGIKYLKEQDLKPKPTLEKLERFGYSANDEATYLMLLSNPNLTDGEKTQIKLKIKEIKTDTDYKINKNPNYKNMNTSTAQ